MNKKLQVILVALVALLLGFSGPAMAKKQVPKVDNFIYFIDHSSSMAFSYKGQRYVQFGGVSKIMMAKSLARELNKMTPELGYKAGLYTFAPYKEYAAMAPYKQATMAAAIEKINTDYSVYGRMTPMGKGLEDLDKLPVSTLSGKTGVFIFSDGDSNCGVDPVAVAQSLKAKYGDNLCFYIVDLSDNKHGQQVLKAIAALGKCNCIELGEELLRNEAAREKFLECALYEWIEDEIVVFRSIYFDFDKYNIKPEFVPVLEEGTAIIKSKTGMKVILEGHTDSIGSEQYNMKLGQRRADSVKAFFVKKGIDASRIETISFGESDPVATNKTAQGRALNRRCVIKFKSM
jgi:OOP family OmpA-OmpF porin